MQAYRLNIYLASHHFCFIVNQATRARLDATASCIRFSTSLQQAVSRACCATQADDNLQEPSAKRKRVEDGDTGQFTTVRACHCGSESKALDMLRACQHVNLCIMVQLSTIIGLLPYIDPIHAVSSQSLFLVYYVLVCCHFCRGGRKHAGLHQEN